MNDLRQEDVRRIQEIDLRMAEYFVGFCEKHNLLCYFCGGGCIGAVRHQGFIPWDDDLDFFMPRDDYERLKDVWADTDEYALLYPSKYYNDHNIFATIRNKNTTMIKPYQRDIDTIHGISIDIFPLDGCPKHKIQRMYQCFWGLVYQLFCAQVIPNNHGKMIRHIAKVMLALVKNSETRYKIWKRAEGKMSQYAFKDSMYVTEICAGPKYMMNEYPKQCFEKALYTAFEDTKMPIPVGYDTYLHMAFGNYMELPPIEERVPSHDAVVIDVNKSYTEYSI